MTYLDIYMLAADVMLHAQTAFIIHALRGGEGLAAAEQMPQISMEQLQARYDFAASALDLIAEPRPVESCLSGEALLVATTRYMEERGHFSIPPASNLVAAWQRLQRSGVLRRRDVDSATDVVERARDSVMSAGAAAAAARGLRACAHAGCYAREVHASHFKSCAACKAVAYCCREHQVADWPAHKKACKAARKAAAEEDGAGPSGT